MTAVDRPFFGRTRILRELSDGLRTDPPRSYALIGPTLIGKTRLLHELTAPHGPVMADDLSEHSSFPLTIDCLRSETERSLAAHVLDQMTRRGNMSDTSQPIEHPPEGIYELERAIQATTRRLTDAGARPVVLLDNLDAPLSASSAASQVAADLDRLMQQMPIVVTSKQPLPDAYAEADGANVFDGMTQLFVGLMEEEAGLHFLTSYLGRWPRLESVTTELVAMTGLHPYLLDRLAYALEDTQGRLAQGQILAAEHLPLIRMRLAEHARPLFMSLWQELQSPPQRVNVRILMPLLDDMLRSPVPIDETSDDQATELNWLINQAVVVYGAQGYELSCPLFADFLRKRVGASSGPRMRRTGVASSDSRFASSLTKTESALLHYFQENSNEVLSPEELLADVWNRPDASPRRVQEAIRRLRLRLDEAVPPVGVIQNERGRGYRFVPASP
jgi:hypothetical protein